MQVSAPAWALHEGSEEEEERGTPESNIRGVKTVHRSQVQTLLQPLKNSFKFTNTETLAYPEKSVLFSHKHMWVTFDDKGL